MIDIIIAPPSARQVAAPKPPPAPAPARLDLIDRRLLDVVRECEPVKLWLVLNTASEELSPRNRAEGREERLKLWQKARRLIGLKLLYRTGRNTIATFKSAATPAGRPRRRKRTVAEATSKILGALKRGRTERPSLLKKETARQNGSQPVRPGKEAKGSA